MAPPRMTSLSCALAKSVATFGAAIGSFEYAITVVTRGSATTFPDGGRKRPWEWNYAGLEFWQGGVVAQATPVQLPMADIDKNQTTWLDTWTTIVVR